MADTSGWGAAASSAISTLGNVAVEAARTRKAYKNQVKAMQQQQDLNKEMWDYQNAYNTPAAQMERLKAAGLNPHLIYGGGSANTGVAGNLDAPEVPVKQPVGADIGDPMLRYLQARQMDAQYKATTQNIELAKKRGALTDIQTALANLKSMQESARSKNFNDLADIELSTKRFLKMRANYLQQNEIGKGQLIDQLSDFREKQMTGIDLDNTFKSHRNELAKLGIYSSDHPAMRILIQSSRRMGIDLGELLAKGAKELKYLLD